MEPKPFQSRIKTQILRFHEVLNNLHGIDHLRVKSIIPRFSHVLVHHYLCIISAKTLLILKFNWLMDGSNQPNNWEKFGLILLTLSGSIKKSLAYSLNFIFVNKKTMSSQCLDLAFRWLFCTTMILFTVRSNSFWSSIWILFYNFSFMRDSF